MPIFRVKNFDFVDQIQLYQNKKKPINLITFASIWGGPGAFGVFDDDIEPLKFVVDPNALDDVEFNADEITFEFGVLLKSNIKAKQVRYCCYKSYCKNNN